MYDPTDPSVEGRHASTELDARASSDVVVRPATSSPAPPAPRYGAPAATHLATPREGAPARYLAGERAPLPREGMLALLDGLLRLPANLMHELTVTPSTHARLAGILLMAMAIAGVFVGAFAGGWQLLAVPLKLALGMGLCALLCLPSLHIFACLSGGEHRIARTSGALLAGVTLTAVLLVGFAPVSWVFSQATDSTRLMGGLHVAFFLVSAHFGLRLTRRALADVGGRPVPALGLWSFVFVLVVLQMSTTLRPLVGPFEGLGLADKEFFLSHWVS